MKTQTTLIKLLSALALAAVIPLCAPSSAHAGPQPHLRTGMFGVARGQVARINAVHIGDPGIRPIQLEMLFIDAMGNVVARDTKTVAAGQATFFDFDFAAFVIEGNRVQLRAVVSALGGPDTKNLKVTIEVFDADTGKNTTFISDPEI